MIFWTVARGRQRRRIVGLIFHFKADPLQYAQELLQVQLKVERKNLTLLKQLGIQVMYPQFAAILAI